ncbi:MAG: ADP-ribosylglycohydrolase family protein, partial [Chitinivibrionales bacterium]|nr:ADP-ribosylglycohydrolase family protein [Chitinivibrionales bacterium]
MRSQKFADKTRFYFALIGLLMFTGMVFAQTPPDTFKLTDAQLIDRIKGGWLAKSAANSLGQPYEGAGPDQNRTLATSFGGGNFEVIRCNDDDTYCPIPFINTMNDQKNGANGIFTATMQDYADAFKKTTYPIWCANTAAMACLKNGILPPYSGGWPLNGVVKNGYGCTCPASEGIGFSFYSQWIGFVTPGLPAACVKLDSICAHVIVYANGYYATIFLDVACSIAPLYTDIHTIVKEARKAVPLQCDIGKNVDTLIWYHDHNPTKTYWDAMNWAFGLNGQTPHAVVNDGGNGSRAQTAVATIALLWGNGDMMVTTLDAARMGQDADCNCGDAGAILGSMLGYSNLPPQWISAYVSKTSNDTGCTYSGTGVSGWTFVKVVDSCVDIAKKAILQSGGSYANGVYSIPVQNVPLPQWFEEYGKVPQPLVYTGVKAIKGAAARRPGSFGLKTAPSGKEGMVFQMLRPDLRPFALQIRDITGRKLWETSGDNSSAVVWRGACASGLYLATLIQGDNSITQKFF